MTTIPKAQQRKLKSKKKWTFPVNIYVSTNLSWEQNWGRFHGNWGLIISYWALPIHSSNCPNLTPSLMARKTCFVSFCASLPTSLSTILNSATGGGTAKINFFILSTNGSFSLLKTYYKIWTFSSRLFFIGKVNNCYPLLSNTYTGSRLLSFSCFCNLYVLSVYGC